MPRIAFVLFLAAVCRAQSPSPSTMEERLAKKLAKPFVKKVAWVLDYDAARKQAKQTGKVIFGYFTRSYAP